MLALVLTPVIGSAQGRDRRPPPAEPSTAAARMRQLVRYLTDWRVFRASEVEEFFPASGEWVWVRQLRGTPRGTTVTRWRFPASDTRLAVKESGPACDALLGSYGGEYAAGDGSLAAAAGERGAWRRVRGNRFVPPGARAASPVFVEWRREGTRWVIAALGDVGGYWRPRTSPEGGIALRLQLPARHLSLPLADSTPVAMEREWYRRGETIMMLGGFAVKYGVPRLLGPNDLVRIGTLDGIPAFAEPPRGRRPTVIYLPQDRAGMFQPYEAMFPGCSWQWEYM